MCSKLLIQLTIVVMSVVVTIVVMTIVVEVADLNPYSNQMVIARS